MYDLRSFINQVEVEVQKHNTGEPGKYSRWLKQDMKGDRDMNASVYGSSIAVDILYTIGRIPDKDREFFIKEIKSYQNPENGIFHYDGSVECHTTAFASGALELLNAKPDYKLSGFSDYFTREGLFSFMNNIDWDNDPWLGAHWGAGIYGAMLLTGSVDDDWEDYYFEWLDATEDVKTGLWMGSNAPLFHYLAAAFHYVFNYEYAKRPIKHIDKILDTCIDAYNNEIKSYFEKAGWPYIDYTYLLVHASRRSGKRHEECQSIIRELADRLMGMVLNDNNALFDDMNTMLAVISAIAVMQDAIPGLIKTSVPLQLILNRRPFI